MGISVFPAPVVDTGFSQILTGSGVLRAVINVPAGYYKVTAYGINGASSPSVTVQFDTTAGEVSSTPADFDSSATNNEMVSFANLPNGATAIRKTAAASSVLVEKIGASLVFQTANVAVYRGTGSLTFTEATNVYLLGGGGGGSGVGYNNSGRAGGGSGFVSSGILAAGTHSYSCGAGGNGGPGNYAVGVATGGTGGTTTFGTLSALGGNGGTGQEQGGNGGNGGSGGGRPGGGTGGTGGSNATGGTVGTNGTGQGTSSWPGAFPTVSGGAGSDYSGGGGSGYGVGGAAGSGNSNGGAGTDGGGGGGASYSSFNAQSGGAGGAGLVVVLTWS